MKRMGALISSLVALAAAVSAQQNPASVSLNSPQCVRVPEARGEVAADEELGVGRGGEYCAYPLRMMGYHRVVNDHLGGPPILVSYDPDSSAGRVFDPVLEGKSYTFDAAPPQQGLPVLKDRETGSLWSALSGAALSGPLAGKQMALVPSLILTWERWKELHPDSWVLAEDARLSPHYTVRTTAPSCPIPSAVSRELLRGAGPRIKPDTLVLGLAAAGETAAFPLTSKEGQYPRRPQVIEKTLGDQRLVLFSDPAARAAAAYRPVVKDQQLAFTVSSAGGAPRWLDRQTGSTWTVEGRCVGGPLKGESLPPADFMRVRWYAWSVLHPKNEIFRQGVLVTPEAATAKALGRFKREGMTGVVLSLRDGETGAAAGAATRVRTAGLDLSYWIEIGRSPVLANAHPEWMASLQGHPEWRRLFPHAPPPSAGTVVKNYPWVPILYQEAFSVHLQRVKSLLQALPSATGIFLNDLQAAPSACGCGNVLCRWTPDYGPTHTTTRLPPDAAAKFLAAVRKLAPGAEIIPVWTTECEEQEKDAACAGVACFPGACWREYTAQLMPVARECETLAVLCLYRAFGRDQSRYGGEAGWVSQALRSFVEMPPQRGGQPIPMPRLIGVVQGWDVTEAQRAAQIHRCREAGAGGCVIALTRIDQGWEPRIMQTSGEHRNGSGAAAVGEDPHAAHHRRER